MRSRWDATTTISTPIRSAIWSSRVRPATSGSSSGRAISPRQLSSYEGVDDEDADANSRHHRRGRLPHLSRLLPAAISLQGPQLHVRPAGRRHPASPLPVGRPTRLDSLPEPAPRPRVEMSGQRGAAMAETVTLTGHEEIRDWAAARMGAPAIVDVSAESGTQPMLRLVFDQQAYQDTDQAERPQNAGGYRPRRMGRLAQDLRRARTGARRRCRNARATGQLSRNRAAIESPASIADQALINCSIRGCRRNGRRSPPPPPSPATPGGCGP